MNSISDLNKNNQPHGNGLNEYQQSFSEDNWKSGEVTEGNTKEQKVDILMLLVKKLQLYWKDKLGASVAKGLRTTIYQKLKKDATHINIDKIKDKDEDNALGLNYEYEKLTKKEILCSNQQLIFGLQDANKKDNKNDDEETKEEAAPLPKQLTCDFGSGSETTACNFEFDEHLGHPNVRWKVGSGQNAFWLGGPLKDRTNMDSTGGYLYFDTSYKLVDKVFSSAALESGERQTIKVNPRDQHPPSPAFSSKFNSSFFNNNQNNKFSSLPQFSNDNSRPSKQFTPSHLIYEKKFMQELWHSNNNLQTSSNPKAPFHNNVFNSSNNRHYNDSQTIPFNVLNSKFNQNQQSNFNHASSNSTMYKQPLVAVQDAIFTPPEAPVPNSGSVLSPNISFTGPMGNCLRFYYNLNGLSAEKLKVLVIDMENMENQTLWHTSKQTDNEWVKVEISYAHDKIHKIAFDGISKDYDSAERTYKGYVSIDDFSYGFLGEEGTAAGMCHGHCTFEGGLCGWTNLAEEDDFDWSQGRGSDSLYTGPSRDFYSFRREFPRGGFLYIDASYPRRPGDKALLRSPLFPAPVVGSDKNGELEKLENNGPICFKFATHMFGNGIGTLRVKVRPSEEGGSDAGSAGEDVAKNDKILWEMSGESGNQWYQAQLSYASTTPYYFIFEGIVGPNYLGNIAIDSIVIEQGACPILPQTANRKSGDCTFEESMCAWTNAHANMRLDHFDWTRQFSYGIYGPKHDHTRSSQNGYFMSLSGDNNLQRGGSYAYLISPPMKNSKQANSLGKCMTFYYYMYQRVIEQGGPSLGGLRIDIRTFSAEDSVVFLPIWRLNNPQSMRWERGQVLIRNDLLSTPNDDYQVVVEGVWGDARVGSIAFDDVTFFDVAEDSNLCKTLPENAAAVDGECSFDRGLCGWKNETLNLDSRSMNSKLDSSSLNGGKNTLIPHKISSPGFIGQPDSLSPLSLNSIHLFSRNQNKPMISWRLATSNSRPNNLQDHTFRAPVGYLYFDVFNQQYMQQPTLRSAKFPAYTAEDQPKSKCLSFWFSAFGRGDNSVLNVFLIKIEEGESSDATGDKNTNSGSTATSSSDKKDDSSNANADEKSENSNAKTLLWTISSRLLDTRRNLWYYAQTSINAETDHQILFQGEASDGGFALDDITFYNGTCATRPEEAAVKKKSEDS